MKYKVEIERMDANDYLATLYVRKWLIFWYVVDNHYDDMGYNSKVIEWQKKYNISDRNVRFIN